MNHCTNMMTKSLKAFQEVLFNDNTKLADKSIADYNNYKEMYDAELEIKGY